MARSKTPKEAKAKDTKATVVEETLPVLQPAVEEVDLDAVLAETEASHGTGIQGYMRDKIKNATTRA